MTDQEITIAVAGAVGTLKWSYALPEKTLHCDVPDYANDLNAMHAAMSCKAMDANDMVALENSLHYVVCQHWTNTHPLYTYSLFNSTARQRAEAFLRTIGKWVE